MLMCVLVVQINARISQKAMIRELTRENERLKAALGATHRQHGIYVTPEQYEQYEEQRVRVSPVTSSQIGRFGMFG